MTIHKHACAMAAAVTASLAYVVCTIVVAIWPSLALTLFSWLVHLENVAPYSANMGITGIRVVCGVI